MRVMVTIDGKLSVHEIIEFEAQDDGSVLLTTPEGTVDLIVRGITPDGMKIACTLLMERGYLDLSDMQTEYDDVFEDDEDEDEDDVYTGFCPACNTGFEFEMTAQAAARGMIPCPHCKEKLFFNICDTDGDMVEFHTEYDDGSVAKVTCPECGNPLSVFQKDVESGTMTCKYCHATLEVTNEEDEE